MLVSCLQSSCTKTGGRGSDFVGRLGPDETLGVRIVVLDVARPVRIASLPYSKDDERPSMIA